MIVCTLLSDRVTGVSTRAGVSRVQDCLETDGVPGLHVSF